ncbi:molybdenum cofactor guanylyltransferase [Listeria booriae]|uniref:Molybdenum cofactor guanylyltransferase n=1 Tax=Listeria booriae TaxID=1552123 RepID=A0A7X0XXV7_9LIST|nr:molybdenum cofactor guanylyltransferase [Listeria booriae]MBC1793740.1 molybdenum cofactor guanylyltransferase [Listeria booriae]MBC1802085.1 molybdenum cofactor guanylyltransferase [Listeria booriae]
MSKINPIAGIVLAGGNSTRFGEDKALYQESPDAPTWVEQTVSKMLPLVDAIFVVTNERLFPAIHQLFNQTGVTVLSDQAPFIDKGPLGGIYAAMSQTPAFSHYLLSPTDTPNITTEIFATLIEQNNAYAVTNTAEHYLTACIPYCKDEIETLLRDDNLRIRPLLQALHTKKQPFQDEAPFFNQNYR